MKCGVDSVRSTHAECRRRHWSVTRRDSDSLSFAIRARASTSSKFSSIKANKRETTWHAGMKKAPVEGRKQEKVGLFLCSLHLILKSNSLHIDISSTSSCLAGKYNLYMQFMGGKLQYALPRRHFRPLKGVGRGQVELCIFLDCLLRFRSTR